MTLKGFVSGLHSQRFLMNLAWESDKKGREEWICEVRKWSVETGLRGSLDVICLTMLSTTGSSAGTISPFRAWFLFKGAEWTCVLFFSSREPLRNQLQVSKYFGDCEADTEIYSGQVYRTVWPKKPRELNRRSFLIGMKLSEGINIIKGNPGKPRNMDIKGRTEYFDQTKQPFLPFTVSSLYSN